MSNNHPPIDPRDEVWQTVQDWALDRLEKIIGTDHVPGVLERPLDAEQTAGERAKAKVLRELLGLPKGLRNGNTTVARRDG